MKTKIKLLLFLLGFLFLPQFCFAAGTDLSVNLQGIKLSKPIDSLVAGETVRIYVDVNNYSDTDGSGLVFFEFQGKTIKQAEVSATASGVYDRVYADFVVPDNDFNMLIKLWAIEPSDIDESNDQVLTPMYRVQPDYDHDGIADNVDNDDDNDGLSDADEAKLGTNKNKADTDGDGVNDLEDEFPLDASKSKKVVPKVEVKTDVPVQNVPAPVVVIPEPKKTPINIFANIKQDKLEQKAELVEAFYNSLEVNQLQTIKIEATPVNWNTYSFNFTTNIADFDTDKLEYVWDFGDGKSSSLNGAHTFKQANGEYLVTLKVKGPFDNYLVDAYKIRIKFWSVFNYWLWLVALLVLLSTFLYSYDFKHRKSADKKVKEQVEQETLRVLRQPQVRNKNKNEDEN